MNTKPYGYIAPPVAPVVDSPYSLSRLDRWTDFRVYRDGVLIGLLHLQMMGNYQYAPFVRDLGVGTLYGHSVDLGTDKFAGAWDALMPTLA